MSINFLDAGLGLALFLFLLRGLLRGMLKELAGLLGLILGFILAGRFYGQLAPKLGRFISNGDTAQVIAYVLIFLAVLVIMALVVVLMRRFMALTFTVWLDHVLGGAVGIVKGALLCALALAIMEQLVPESPFLTESVLAPYVDRVTALVSEYLPAFLHR